MAIQVHVLAANGSVTRTADGQTLGSLVDRGDETMRLVRPDGSITEYIIWQVTDVQKHGIVANVDEVVTFTPAVIAQEWIEDNIE